MTYPRYIYSVGIRLNDERDDLKISKIAVIAKNQEDADQHMIQLLADGMITTAAFEQSIGDTDRHMLVTNELTEEERRDFESARNEALKRLSLTSSSRKL